MTNGQYIVDVKKVLQKLTLSFKDAGSNYQLVCPNPLHNDSHEDGGSMFVHKKDLVFNCFGCDWKGSIFTLIMLLQKINFEEAVEWLKTDGNFGVDNKKFLLSEIEKRIKAEIQNELQEERNPFYLPVLQDIVSDRIFSFFRRRHITKEVALNYGAKVCLEGFYQNRIILPIIQDSKLLGFEARIFDKALDPRKCLYPPNSSLKNTIFDLNSLNRLSPLFFTEGMMDCLSLKSRGYLNSSCSFGSKLTKRQMKILNTFKTIVVIPDNDHGGEELFMKFYNEVKSPQLFLALPPPNIDIDECKDEDVHKIINSKVLLSDYVVDKFLTFSVESNQEDLLERSKKRVNYPKLEHLGFLVQ